MRATGRNTPAHGILCAMDSTGQAAVETPAPQLDLRRVLFELLVLQGMNRQLGYSGKVDAVTGQPDAVVEAQHFIAKPAGCLKSLQSGVSRQHNQLHEAISILVVFAITLSIVYYCDFENRSLMLFLLLFLAVGLLFALLRPWIECETCLVNDKLFHTWLGLFAANTGKIDGKVLKRATDYRVLSPTSWRRTFTASLILIPLNFISRLILILIGIYFGFQGELIPAIQWFIVGVLLLSIGLDIRDYHGKASPPALRTYLIQHLVASVQLREGAVRLMDHAQTQEVST